MTEQSHEGFWRLPLVIGLIFALLGSLAGPLVLILVGPHGETPSLLSSALYVPIRPFTEFFGTSTPALCIAGALGYGLLGFIVIAILMRLRK